MKWPPICAFERYNVRFGVAASASMTAHGWSAAQAGGVVPQWQTAASDVGSLFWHVMASPYRGPCLSEDEENLIATPAVMVLAELNDGAGGDVAVPVDEVACSRV